MSISCDVVFDNNPEKVVYTGQSLRGTVHLVFSEPKNVRGIFIKIKGEAKTRWRQGRNSCDSTGNQEYLNEKKYLVGGESGEVQLTPGNYHYSFQIGLPADLPSSFEGEHGHIRYRTCVVLDTPMWLDKNFEDPFTVIKTVNLNENSLLKFREPVIGELDHKFFKFGFICCLRSEPLSMNARLTGGGAYAPGQNMSVELVADNKSDQEIVAFTVQLISEITYYTTGHIFCTRSTQETIILTETSTSGCGINERKTFHPCLYVPQTPPSDDSTDNIVQIQHYCRIAANVGLMHMDPEIKLPLIIGTSAITAAPYKSASESDGVIQKQPVKTENNDSFNGGASAPLLPRNVSFNPPKDGYSNSLYENH